MSITVSDVQALCDTGRVGWVYCKVTRAGGDYAWVWVWVNGAYSIAPGLAADGSTRSTGSDGVYVGFGTIDLASAPVADWSAPPVGLDATSSVDPGPAPTADPTDPAVIADVASAAADSGVVSAATTAATADAGSDYATSTTADVLGPAFVSITTYSLSSGDPNPYVRANILSGYTGADTTNHGAVTLTSSDPSVVVAGTPAWDPTGGGSGVGAWIATLTPTGTTGTVALTFATTTPAAPVAMSVTMPLTVTS